MKLHYLQGLPDQHSNFAVLWVFVSSYDEFDNAGGVTKDRSGVSLSHAHQRVAVDLDDLVVHLKRVNLR